MEIWADCGAGTYIGQNDNSSSCSPSVQSYYYFSTLSAGIYYVKIYGAAVNGTSTYNPNYYLTVIGCPDVNMDFNWTSPASGVYHFQTTTPFPSSSYNVVWNFGDGNTASGTDNVTHNYALSGTYTVTCTATFLLNSNCVYTKNYQVSVFACTIVVDFTWTNMGSGTYKFQTNGSYAADHTIQWTFGDGGTASGSDIVYHTFAFSGHPTVSLYVINNLHQDCWRYVEHIVPVCNVDAEFTATGTGNGQFLFSLVQPYSASDYYIDWFFGDGSGLSNSLPTVLHTYAASGNYFVSVLVTYKYNYNCWDYKSMTLPVTVCGLNVQMYSNSIGFGQYEFYLSQSFLPPDYIVTWNFGDGTITAGSSVIYHTYATSGIYHVIATVQHTSQQNCVFTVDSYFNVNGCSLDPDFTWLYEGDGNVKFELQNLLLSEIWSVNWSFGDGNFSTQAPVVYHTYATPGTYTASLYVYNVNQQGCNALVNHQIIVTPVPGWTVNNTGTNHSIIIPANTPILINNTPVLNGDYIGVYYLDDSNNLACGGFIVWDGATAVLTAWGDDFGTPQKDGFDTDEAFTWIIWRASNFTEYTSSAIYMPVGGAITHQGYYANNGMSGILSLNYPGYQQQNIQLNAGWGIMSTYINPLNPSIDQVFVPVVSNLNIAKSGSGGVYWPPFNVNTIGNMIIGQGYQINMSSNQLLPVIGFAAVPETTPVNIPLGWSFLGYLRQTAADIEDMLSSIVSNIIIVKDELGNTYWPLLFVNTIGNMEPGEGYQINLSSPATLLYPPNGPSATAKSDNLLFNEHYTQDINTGNNMTLGIPESAWQVIPQYGDEIGVFTASGELTGCGVYTGSNMAIAVWGDDLMTPQQEGLSEGDAFTIKIWNPLTGNEYNLVVENWLLGNEYFTNNAIAVVGKLAAFAENYNLYQNVPNPFKISTRIKFYIPESSFVKLEVYNVLGEVVCVAVNETLDKGEHLVTLNAAGLSAGTYMYRLTTNGFTETKQMDIIK
jgi:PKD repeat protein